MSPSSQTRKHDYVAYQSNPEVNKSLPGFYSATNTYHLGQEKKKVIEMVDLVMERER